MTALAMLKAYVDSQRLAYVESAEVLLDANTELNANADVTIAFNGDAGENLLEVGRSYTVTTDSGTYTGVCKQYDGADVYYVGNIKPLSGEDTGDSYCLVSLYDNGWAVGVFDYRKGSHVRVVGNETVKTIDPKYLPGVCLPVVELETELTTTLSALSDADVTKLDALNGAPCLLTCSTALGAIVTGVATNTAVGDIATYRVSGLVEADLDIMLFYSGGTWQGMYQYG